MATEKKHTLFSASSMDRIFACPGSVMFSKDFPRTETKYAKEGTDAHTCLETLLKNGIHKQLATESFLRKTYSEEMVTLAASAAKEIWIARASLESAELISESKSALDFIDPDMGGTSDVVIVEDFGTLWIIDFKFGTMVVEPKDNAQLLTYALAEAHKHDYNFERVILTVIQPRAFHPSGKTIRSWITDVDRLFAHRDDLILVAKKARGKNPPFAAGDHCFFCPGRAACPEVSTKALAQAKADFSPKTGVIELPKTLPDDRDLGKLLEALDKLDTWAKGVRAHAYHRLTHGAKISGWKLVDKRATRKWTNYKKVAAEAREAFGKTAFTVPELLSPAQLEDATKDRKWVAKRVSKVSSGTTMVRDADDRDGKDNKAQLAIDFAPEPRKKKKL